MLFPPSRLLCRVSALLPIPHVAVCMAQSKTTCYWFQCMLCANVPAALNWVGMTVSSICFLAPRKPLCHSLSGRSPWLCCKHWSQKNTHWVLGLASTLTTLSWDLPPQSEQPFKVVWFPSKASGYSTTNHSRKWQQRMWYQALLLHCVQYL